MIDDIDELYTRSQEILNIINGVYQEYDVPLPTRQLIIAGESVHDCEQVSVSFMNFSAGLPQQETPPPNCEPPYNFTIMIEIVRGSTVSKRGKNTASIKPTSEDINEKTLTIMQDIRLLGEIGQRLKEANWFPLVPYSISPGPHGGGLQSVLMEVNMAL